MLAGISPETASLVGSMMEGQCGGVTMKAVWLTQYGGPEVLVARETPDPVPGPDEVLLNVAAASITFIETLVRANRIPWPSGDKTPPYVPGNGVGGIGRVGRRRCRR